LRQCCGAQKKGHKAGRPVGSSASRSHRPVSRVPSGAKRCRTPRRGGGGECLRSAEFRGRRVQRVVTARRAGEGWKPRQAQEPAHTEQHDAKRTRCAREGSAGSANSTRYTRGSAGAVSVGRFTLYIERRNEKNGMMRGLSRVLRRAVEEYHIQRSR